MHLTALWRQGRKEVIQKFYRAFEPIFPYRIIFFAISAQPLRSPRILHFNLSRISAQLPNAGILPVDSKQEKK
jgi:hypothetical protein